MARYLPLTPRALATTLAERCRPGGRVLVDGADAAGPAGLADAAATLLRAAGTPCVRVSAADFLRPASLRLEHGHTDELSYRTAWFDVAALRREVLEPLGPGGTGWWLPSLWNPRTDRATRVARQAAAPGTVLLLDGPMLLGADLPAELGVHLHLSEAALRRATPPGDAWTVPALLAHEAAVGTDEAADLLVRAEHAERPALRVA